MTAAAMLSHKSRRWGYRNNDDSEEEVVEVDDNKETVAASGGGGRRKGGFEESLRRMARPTAPTGRMGAVTAKSTKTRRCKDDGGSNVVSRRQVVGRSQRR
jgi:hypothetical protein